MRKPLTAVFIDKARPPAGKDREDYFDALLPAFGVRVGRKRKSYFVLVRTLRNGEWKLQRCTLGTTTELTLAEAREAARQAIARAQQGEAPIEVKRARREAQKAESRNTFANVRAEFLRLYRTRQKRKPSPRTLAELKRVLESDRFAPWADRPLATIARRDIMDVADALVAEGHETAANRYLTYLKMLFSWALDRGIVEADPAALVRKPGMEASRARVLSLAELRAIWQAAGSSREGDLFASIVKILILTGQRRNEVAGMRWPEVDLDAALWTLPAARAKNNREHLVPLSAPVVALLMQREAEQALLKPKDAAGRPTQLVFTSTGAAPFSGWSRSKARLDGRAQIPGWTLHDCRRTLVTRLGEDLHVPPHVVEAVVNHVSGTRAGVAGVYNRALYLDERKAALGAWADYVLRVVGEVASDNVIELGR